MKKDYSFIGKTGILLLGSMLCFSLSAQKPETEIAKTDVAPVVDGVIDDVWADVEKNNIDRPWGAETPTVGAEGETYWSALWTDDGIYVLVEVTDDVWAPFYASEAPNQGWKYDKVELYFDVNYIKEDGLGGGSQGNGHYSPQPAPVLGESGVEQVLGDAGMTYAYLEENPTYNFEFFVPFSYLVDLDGIIVDKSEPIGFDVQVIDNDVLPEADRHRMVWSNVGNINENWANMDDAGLITLAGAGDLIYVESIELADGEITVDNDTLDMMPVVTPADASTQDFNWELTNVTGRANITADGKIIPILDGTVTVQAFAIDGSWVESNVATITISGQRATLDELSYILNGDLYMEEGAAGLPEYWKGSNLTIIEDGVAVCVPAEVADPWGYKFAQRINVPFERKDLGYTLYFKAWAELERLISFNFEDANGETNYDRYGYSSDPEANVSHDYVGPGESEWGLMLSTEPTSYEFHVTFTDMTETTNQDFNFFLAEALGMVYIDSVFLVADEDVALLPTAIPDMEAAGTLEVYPNPVDGNNVLNVVHEGSAEALLIYNIYGQKLMEKQPDGDLTRIDVSGLAPGMYFVKTKGSHSIRFVKH